RRYEAAKNKANINQKQLKQIRGIEKRISDLKKLQMANKNALANLGSPEAEYNGLRKKWDEFHVGKIQALDGQCQQFSTLSNGLIRANILQSLDVDSLKQKFKTAFSGLNIKEQKI